MERWIQMHYQIKERERALEISKSRELFYWLGAFYNVSLIGLFYRYKKNLTTQFNEFTFVCFLYHMHFPDIKLQNDRPI